MLTFPHQFDLGDFGEVEVMVRGELLPGSPGQFAGPPERCHPPESSEFEAFDVQPLIGQNSVHYRQVAYALKSLLQDGVFELTETAYCRLCDAAETAYEERMVQEREDSRDVD